MFDKKYNIGTRVIMKKVHPCGTNLWEIIRLGADIKIKCIECKREVMLPRIEFNKRIKKIVEGEGNGQEKKIKKI